jgi:hypothetical protein
MTSTRSRTTKRPAETPKEALVSLARHAARIQVAAATAGARFVAGWAHAAERYTQTVGDELLRRVEGQTDSTELLARVASATSNHLRDVTALPGEAADHFNRRLSESDGAA